MEKFKSYRGESAGRMILFSRRKFRDPQVIDLVKKLLTVDHKERITTEEALTHPFFGEVEHIEQQQSN
jgi:serine/threonine protein kinase